MPLGARPVEGGVAFRLWAPARRMVHIVSDGQRHALTTDGHGYFEGVVAGMQPGSLYQLQLDEEARLYADPASRFQPEGPEGPSEVMDASAYRWTDDDWRGIEPAGQVIYEMHIGTFTPEGTYRAAAEKLAFLKEIGVTLIEMMPVNEFFGAFGWGYDGVLPFAPTRLYGRPDDLRAFIDQAHGLGIGVILDVVYNHFGLGECFEAFSPDYFTDAYANEWGRSINFDGRNAEGTRAFFAANAAAWVEDYHFDGLRLDATQALFDKSDDHIIAEIARAARAAAGQRRIYIVGENEPQAARLIRPAREGGYGLEALWNDDFHHSATAVLTGRNEAYYHDHRGMPQEFISAAKFGFLFQGQRYDWQNHGRGEPARDRAPCSFVHFLQNHDQVANSGRGLRASALTSMARLRAATALLLLGPQTPMLFQGQEFFAATPFFYFADHADPKNADMVRNGRIAFLQQFPSLRDPEIVAQMADPCDAATFQRSKLDWQEAASKPEALALHRDLLRLRREEPAFRQAERRRCVDGSVIGPSAFLLRFEAEDPWDDRLLLVNFGADLTLISLPDPLFAPPAGCQWSVRWSSEAVAYGGTGQKAIDTRKRFRLPGESALLFHPQAMEDHPMMDKAALDEWQAGVSEGG
ncbi:malto-oligosyltrehalose trehalohydrolase [Xaviernesmea oryzae]|nr:malto-oligosyltrehalose trehalohydrolase [Xaviernesmea oryzae]